MVTWIPIKSWGACSLDSLYLCQIIQQYHEAVWRRSLNRPWFNAKILCKRFASYTLFQSGKVSSRANSRYQSICSWFYMVVAWHFVQTWPSSTPWNRVNDWIEILYFGGNIDSTPTLNWINIQIFFLQNREYTNSTHTNDSLLPKITMQYVWELFWIIK